MKFASIKSRLLLMLVVCMAGMALLVASQHYFTQQLVGLHQQRDTLLRLGQDLLQMRRHEKDFLLRHQLDYFHRFSAQAEAFEKDLAALEKNHQLTAQTDSLAANQTAYAQLFGQVVRLQTRIGLHAEHGLRGELSQIEQRLLAQGGSSAALARAQAALQQFLLSRKPASQQQFEQAAATLLKTTQEQSMRTLVQRYITTFDTLAQAMRQMGLTHNDGLHGRFRQQAHQMEAALGQIDEALGPAIARQEQHVQRVSISIALGTSGVLLLLLVKSFATFHQAFANFVMFFYRCKRQYQPIDARQLGFAEFRSLAELANEMVESRRDAERRLAAAEAQLAQAGQVSSPGSSGSTQ